MSFDPHANLTSDVIFSLGWLYLVLFAMNVYWTFRSIKRDGHIRMWDVFGGQDVPISGFWIGYTIILGLVAAAHFTTNSAPEKFLIRMPEWFKLWADAWLAYGNAAFFFVLAILMFVVIIVARHWLIRPTVAWILLNLSILFVALSMTDWDFRQIVGKPDNVPIVSMLFIVGFFTWLYFSRAVDNDRRIEQGRELFENEKNEKVLVWPDLVYTEMICMVVLTVVLVAWGLLLQAPLEEPANSARTPNPSKAPWYFLGLQEMLVYYDPWLAGVVFPSMIVVGLMAIPYIDYNTKGNGYYTFNQRKFAITVFMFGFMALWIAMIILGTFMRGPNWNIFGIYEFWDVHKLLFLSNVNLSEYVWVHSTVGDWFGGPPSNIFLRESPGLLLTAFYLLALPPLMAATVFRKFYMRMGFIRFMVFANLVLLMAALPIKMVLRWLFNLKYIVAIPEYFFNI